MDYWDRSALREGSSLHHPGRGSTQPPSIPSPTYPTRHALPTADQPTSAPRREKGKEAADPGHPPRPMSCTWQQARGGASLRGSGLSPELLGFEAQRKPPYPLPTLSPSQPEPFPSPPRRLRPHRHAPYRLRGPKAGSCPPGLPPKPSSELDHGAEPGDVLSTSACYDCAPFAPDSGRIA